MQPAPLAAAILIACALVSVDTPAQSLTTTFVSNNSGTTAWTNQFDITVLHPNGATITAFDVNCENVRAGGIGSPFTLDIWITQVGGTYVGNQTNPTVWMHVTQGSSVSRAKDTPTPVDVPDFKLAPGIYGMALEYNGTAMAYTNGSGANQSYANADIRLDLGSSTSGQFTGSLFNPRVWNGTVYYFVGNATWRSFGDGCKGTIGVPTLAPAMGSLPKLGSNFTLEIGGLPMIGLPAFAFAGGSKKKWGPFALPYDLSIIGATGCSLLVSTLLTASTASTSGTASLIFPIPNSPALPGVPIFLQGAAIDIGANPLGLIMTNAVEAYFGT